MELALVWGVAISYYKVKVKLNYENDLNKVDMYFLTAKCKNQHFLFRVNRTLIG